jgi:acyl carrier protein
MSPIISSRTPEGDGAKCPFCQAQVSVERSVVFGDAVCPHCGQLLWFTRLAGETRLFDTQLTETARDRVLDIAAQRLGIDRARILNNPNLLNELQADSLDLVEFIMELEEEFPLNLD